MFDEMSDFDPDMSGLRTQYTGKVAMSFPIEDHRNMTFVQYVKLCTQTVTNYDRATTLAH